MSGMHWNRIKKPVVSFRRILQIIAAVSINGYAIGYSQRKLYTGKSKALCIPVLNCYSCPGAITSCPIGALQTVIGDVHSRFPFYVLGMLMLSGILAGRLVCGFLCPFGLIQELIHKIPHPQITIPKKTDRFLRCLKYLILLVMVILLPAFTKNEITPGTPYFCKYFCPVGTLEGGIPLVLFNKDLRNTVGLLFQWKTGVLLFILISSVFISRAFCRYFCPLGAFYSLFNRFSFYHMNLEQSKCTGCKTCEKACPMQLELTQNMNHPECIRCGICKETCPGSAISASIYPFNK